MQEWIDVNHKLPKPSTEALVVVLTPSDRYLCLASLEPSLNGLCWVSDLWLAHEEVTHWLPLPAMPAMSEDKECTP